MGRQEPSPPMGNGETWTADVEFVDSDSGTDFSVQNWRRAQPRPESRCVTYAEIEMALRKSLDARMVFAHYPAGDPFTRWAMTLWENLKR